MFLRKVCRLSNDYIFFSLKIYNLLYKLSNKQICYKETLVRSNHAMMILYYNRLIGHENSYVTELRSPLNVRRRLKRQWPSDLKDQREEEE
jgi:hypothetical protein